MIAKSLIFLVSVRWQQRKSFIKPHSAAQITVLRAPSRSPQWVSGPHAHRVLKSVVGDFWNGCRSSNTVLSNFVTCRTPFPGLNISRTSTSVFELEISPRWGHPVARWFEARRYKPEGCGFDFKLNRRDFFHWHNPSGDTLALSLYSPVG